MRELKDRDRQTNKKMPDKEQTNRLTQHKTGGITMLKNE